MRPSVEAVAQAVSDLAPGDEHEADDIAVTLRWLQRTDDVFRRVKPDVPDRHLVSYVVPVDPDSGHVVLGDHLNAGLWLPPGGHVEPTSTPRSRPGARRPRSWASTLDPSSALSRRLRIIQEHITDWLNQRPGVPLTAVSICAGQGHDLIGVLAQRTDADRVHATLLEYDERNVAAARAAAEGAGLTEVVVRRADAGDPAAYRGAVPADLVLLAGVFGNIDDADIRTTIAALPQLCSRGATVIWTRSRRRPDRTGSIRAWLEETGFAKVSFTAPPGDLFSVGVHRLNATPRSLTATTPLFRFTRS